MVVPVVEDGGLAANGLATPAAVDPFRLAPTFQSRVWSVRGALVLLGVCASLALAIGWRSVAPKPPSLRILTVTSFPGAEGMPSLSPDGNFVVFTWRGIDSTEAADVWVKAVDGDELRGAVLAAMGRYYVPEDK